MANTEMTLLIDRTRGHEISDIPVALADAANRRALEIFETEARTGATFQQCLGQIYLIGVKVGLKHIKDVLAQSLDCINDETPEDCSREEAREDTILKIRDILNAK
jgi:hypothetical protein